VKITSCVPLAGQGVIARYGAMVAVTDGRGPDPDPLLSVLAETAASGGDGGDFVLGAARAALGCHGQPAWACAGVTADGGVAVLVYGRAVVTVRVDGGPEVMLTASDSVIPVSRKFAGATVALALAVGELAVPDPQFWLGDGVVRGGGLAVTVAADAGELARLTPAAPPSAVVAQDPVLAKVPPTVLEIGAVGAVGAVGAMAGLPDSGATINSDDWFTQQQSAAPGAWHPPTVGTPIGPSAPGPSAPGPPADAQAGELAGGDDPQAVQVDGVPCARDHFNDPSARVCRQCGIGLDQPPRNFQRRARPPLGVLVLDDGARFTLDRDYVIGREPTFDSDVIDGRARPLRINDPNGTVSRLHLRISLVGWQVEVSDLGSANGSVLQSSGTERPLAPFEPTIIDPGARIGIGHRSMQYLAYQGVLP
jgi:FHA domain